MATITKNLVTIEHHCLDLRYTHLRLHKKSSAQENLVSSIEQNGQLMPVIIIPGAQQNWILIDGYLRLQALKRLGADTVEAEVWQCDAMEALLAIIKMHSGRALEVFEEALLLKELHTKHDLSQNALSRHIGRDPSWVNRRLALIEFLPADTLQAMSNGEISLWVASRILAPLARANAEHAQMVLNYVRKNFHNTREMEAFYKHYQHSNRQERVNMVNKPALFFKVQKIIAADNNAALLRDGPEGKWKYKLNLISVLLAELVPLVPSVLGSRQEPATKEELTQKFNATKVQFNTLDVKVEELLKC